MMRITNVSAEPDRMIGSRTLQGTVTFEEGEVKLVIPLSQETLKTLEECVERDYDVEVGRLKCGS